MRLRPPADAGGRGLKGIRHAEFLWQRIAALGASTRSRAEAHGRGPLRRAFVRPFPAIGANPFQMNGIVEDLEVELVKVWRREPVQTGVIEVGDTIAAPAD